MSCTGASVVGGSSYRLASIVLGIALAALSTTVVPCGLEDPSSIALRRGVLNLAYPQSLYVGTAVWQAQAAGSLPPDALAQREDLGPEARATLRLFKANALLRQLAAKLSGLPGAGPPPKMAVVLLGPVLWSRFEPQDGAVRATVHVAGPEQDDLVIVTEIPAIQAIVEGDLSFADAFALGVMRLYGPPADAATAQSWLAGLARS